MRQYRGIPIGETEFVYGWYVECEKGKHYIVPAPTTWEHMGILFAPLHAQVIPETVGQSTGTLFRDDKTEVFLGDLCQRNNGEQVFEVEWNNFQGKFYLHDYKESRHNSMSFARVCTRIGDIHQHPKLLEAK